MGDAINESLSDSEQISSVVSEIKTYGYEVFLLLDATIGYNAVDKIDVSFKVTEPENPESKELKLNTQDKNFLKSLKIDTKGME